MKTIETIKKGDKVYAYTTDPRNANYEGVVKSVGPKFITIDGVGRWMNKFLKATLVCEEWGAYRLFLGNKEEFEDCQNTKAEREILINEIIRISKNFSREQLRDLREYINGLNQ
ncbi:MAG: hypothetical protein IJ064_05740 [Bacteroidaceae bacterium]|nr:hypothetical protein [Bacteroidaceae bacterium]